jgi:hypothetical protein
MKKAIALFFIAIALTFTGCNQNQAEESDAPANTDAVEVPAETPADTTN